MLALFLLSEAGGEGPNTSLSWLLYIGFAFFLLMVIVGWLVSRTGGNQSKIQHGAKEEGDDLARIEGIGPKVAKVLNIAGIKTFEELAKADPAGIQKILNEAGMQMMNPEGWIDQARLAAKGDWTGFEKLQSELKGGRRTK